MTQKQEQVHSQASEAHRLRKQADDLARRLTHHEEVCARRPCGLCLNVGSGLMAYAEDVSRERTRQALERAGRLEKALRNLLADYTDAMGEWGTGTAVYKRAEWLSNEARTALSDGESVASEEKEGKRGLGPNGEHAFRKRVDGRPECICMRPKDDPLHKEKPDAD